MEGQKKFWQSKSILMSIITGVCMALVPAVPALKPVGEWIANNSLMVGAFWSALAVAFRWISKDKIVLVD